MKSNKEISLRELYRLSPGIVLYLKEENKNQELVRIVENENRMLALAFDRLKIYRFYLWDFKINKYQFINA